ncbi:MAG: hypothetical protein SF187_22495 [Deltaproteobacteria bacterium]|nr:hypothetical protein [Deltaproteobacteria bacterium]
MKFHHPPRQNLALLKRGIPALGLVLVLFWGAPARAETPAERAAAKQAFIDGDNAFKNERYEDALAAFTHGYELSQKPRFLLNIAHTQRKLGRLRDALANYKQFLDSSPNDKDRALAEQMVAEVEPLVAKEDADRAMREREAQSAAIAEPAPDVAAPGTDLQAAAPPPAPVYKRWYFWAGVGAVVAAGVVTAVVLSGGDDAAKAGSWGELRL